MKALIAASAVLLAGCTLEPTATQAAGSNGAQVETVAAWEDCVLWRINDGRRVYVARCGDDRTTASWSRTTSAGKVVTTHQERVETLQ